MITRGMPAFPPEDCLPEPGAPSMPWNRWQTLFGRYLFLREMEDRRKCRTDVEYIPLNDEDKNSMLFMALGKEGCRQFMSLPNGDKFDRTYTDFLKDAQNLFQKKDKVHTLVVIYEFRRDGSWDQRLPKTSISPSYGSWRRTALGRTRKVCWRRNSFTDAPARLPSEMSSKSTRTRSQIWTSCSES